MAPRLWRLAEKSPPNLLSLVEKSNKNRIGGLSQDLRFKNRIKLAVARLLSIVRKRDTAAPRQWVSSAPAVRSGLDIDEAFALSVSFIQHWANTSLRAFSQGDR